MENKLLKDFGKKCFPKNFILHYFNTKDMSDIDNENYQYLFCMRNDGKVFCRIYQYDFQPNILYISDLHVDSDIQKQGIGTQIMEIFENIGKLSNCNLYLFCDKDRYVVDWYKNLGFEIVETKHDNENQIWMNKVLL